MHSMTGFGSASATGEGISIQVELRSVNNRFCDVNLRLPKEYADLEPGLVRRIKDRFSRGRIDATIRREAISATADIQADVELARRYRDALEELSVLANSEISLDLLSRFPGVLTAREVVQSEGEPDLVVEALEAAMEGLASMRRVEGDVQNLVEDLVPRLQERLVDRIAALVDTPMDPQRLAQETALLADRADISEEMSRIGGHLDQLRALAEEQAPVGRRLEFMAQELHREVNTIGSKSQEATVSVLVVEMKASIERIREQAANVE